MGFLDRAFPFGQVRHRPRQFVRGQSITLPAPYGGLNLRDQIDALKPNEARVLENWFPDGNKLVVRPGFEAHGSSLGSSSVPTLTTWDGLASSKLIAGANGNLYDVSSSGAGSSLGSGFSGNTWQTARFNARVFFVNGVDAPQDYDGTTLSSTSWSGSGLTITDLVNVANVRNRLWFCETDQADVWYGGIGAVTSTLTKFQLSQIASGGFTQAIGSWSRDAGDGMDDLTVFVMSTGQLIVYTGDPASTFTLVGKYDTGAAPIGRQCLIKMGGELVVITRLGLLPISAAMSQSGGKALSLASIDPWGKVAPYIAEQAVRHGAQSVWSGTLHQGVLYVNIPFGSTSSGQAVLNTRTGSWTTYSSWNAAALASFGNDLYFGALDGGVVRKIDGTDDNSASIVSKARQAFTMPSRNGARSYAYTALRLRLQAEGALTGTLGVDTDYFDSNLVGAVTELNFDVDTTPWGSEWGSPWGSTPEPVEQWLSVEGDGRSVAPRLTTTSDGSVEWNATDVLMIPGSIK